MLIFCFVLQKDPSKEYKTVDEPGVSFEYIHGVYDSLLDTVSGSIYESKQFMTGIIFEDFHISAIFWSK